MHQNYTPPTSSWTRITFGIFNLSQSCKNKLIFPAFKARLSLFKSNFLHKILITRICLGKQYKYTLYTYMWNQALFLYMPQLIRKNKNLHWFYIFYEINIYYWKHSSVQKERNCWIVKNMDCYLVSFLIYSIIYNWLLLWKQDNS